MQKYKCLIIEDEPLAAGILEDYIQQIPYLQLIGICPDAIYALEILKKSIIDVIFLDIHLPKLKGLDFLKTLKHPPEVIVTTAYHQYALEGYELNVTDYLLKPIEFSRFLQAVNKLSTQPRQKEVAEIETGRKYYFFNINKKMVKIWLDEILYIESVKDYIRIYLPEKAIVTKSPISKIEDDLKKDSFLRIHRSYLVPIDKVTAFSATEIEIGATRLPIGRNFREQVLQIMESVRNKFNT